MLPGMPLPDGRPGEERQALLETAAAKHSDHHGTHVARRRRWDMFKTKLLTNSNTYNRAIPHMIQKAIHSKIALGFMYQGIIIIHAHKWQKSR